MNFKKLLLVIGFGFLGSSSFASESAKDEFCMTSLHFQQVFWSGQVFGSFEVKCGSKPSLFYSAPNKSNDPTVNLNGLNQFMQQKGYTNIFQSPTASNGDFPEHIVFEKKEFAALSPKGTHYYLAWPGIPKDYGKATREGDEELYSLLSDQPHSNYPGLAKSLALKTLADFGYSQAAEIDLPDPNGFYLSKRPILVCGVRARSSQFGHEIKITSVTVSG